MSATGLHKIIVSAANKKIESISQLQITISVRECTTTTISALTSVILVDDDEISQISLSRNSHLAHQKLSINQNWIEQLNNTIN